MFGNLKSQIVEIERKNNNHRPLDGFFFIEKLFKNYWLVIEKQKIADVQIDFLFFYTCKIMKFSGFVFIS